MNCANRLPVLVHLDRDGGAANTQHDLPSHTGLPARRAEGYGSHEQEEGQRKGNGRSAGHGIWDRGNQPK